jgi:alpha-glucosidase
VTRRALDAPTELALGLRHDDTLVAGGGAPGTEVTFSLWAREGAAQAVDLRCAPDGEEELHAMRVVERARGHARWAATLRPRAARLRYRFRIDRPDGVVHYAMAGLSAFDPTDAFDFTHLAGPRPAEWPLDAVLYQIFPDRFDDGDPSSNVRDGEWSLRGTPTRARRFGEPLLPWAEARNLDFYGGDLQGVARRLDHLARLGVNGLFLNPIWPALSNHRYDLTDHARVDPHLGGDEALADLAARLRARSMRLVLDVVLNHTGSAHPWFNREGLFPSGGAFRDPAAKERAYYSFDEWPARYRAWFGIDTLPRLDLSNPELVEILIGALRRFLEPPFSVDGYRFDVANMIGRDGELQAHRPLWARITGALRAARPEVYLVGEHFFDPDKLLKGDGLDGAMAYHAFTFPVRAWLTGRDRRGGCSTLDGAQLVAHLRACFARVGWAAWRRSTLHVNTHDLPRLQTAAGDGRALEVATALALALPGVPCLYYGDEVGLEGGADPDNRRCMEWDEARWDASRLEATRARVARRRGSPSLCRGGLVDLGSTGDLVAVARVLDGAATEVVVASRAEEPLEVALPAEALPGGRPLTVELPPRSARVVALDG